MIPLGNWEETNDELRNQIADLEDINAELESENEQLRSALNAADTDIADYLFELDHLHHKHAETELDVEGLLTLVEYWQEKAASYGQELRDYKIVHPENDELVEYWRRRCIAVEASLQEEWERANDLETSSISIEESRELTNRNLELDRDLRHKTAEYEALNQAYDKLEEENNDLANSYAEIAIANLELKKALRTLSE